MFEFYLGEVRRWSSGLPGDAKVAMGGWSWSNIDDFVAGCEC